MKIEEAIQYVYLGNCNDAVKNIVVDALKKQIPKKPIDDFSTHAIYDDDGNYLEQFDITIFKCPICNHILASGELNRTDCVEIHCCESCGQALDWSDEE